MVRFLGKSTTDKCVEKLGLLINYIRQDYILQGASVLPGICLCVNTISQTVVNKILMKFFSEVFGV